MLKQDRCRVEDLEVQKRGRVSLQQLWDQGVPMALPLCCGSGLQEHQHKTRQWFQEETAVRGTSVADESSCE